MPITVCCLAVEHFEHVTLFTFTVQLLHAIGIFYIFHLHVYLCIKTDWTLSSTSIPLGFTLYLNSENSVQELLVTLEKGGQRISCALVGYIYCIFSDVMCVYRSYV